MFNVIGNFINNITDDFFSLSKVNKGIKVNFTDNLLPQEITLEIFSNLNNAQLRNCSVVNHTWNVLASDENLWNAVILREKTFGKKQWETYFGEIGKEPPLPTDIHKILKSPCPFFPGKKVGETHMLVLIPETVNGKPLNLTLLEKLVKAPKKGYANNHGHIWNAILKDVNINQATAKLHWALMTMSIAPGSENKPYPTQKDIIAEVAKQTNINYEVPNVLDAAICIFIYFTSSGKYLFNDTSGKWTETRCQEIIQISNQFYQLAVSGFAARATTKDSFFNEGTTNIGVAALRKFF